MKYTQLTTESGTKVIVKDNDDGSTSYIPIDETNSDYQAYLAWLENPNAEITPPVL